MKTKMQINNWMRLSASLLYIAVFTSGNVHAQLGGTPRLCFLKVYERNSNPKTAGQVRNYILNELKQSKQFKVENNDKVLRVLKNPRNNISTPCFESNCLKQVAGLFPESHYILSTELTETAISMELKLRIYNQISESIRIDFKISESLHDSTVESLSKRAVRELLNRLKNQNLLEDTRGLKFEENSVQLMSTAGIALSLAGATLWYIGYIEREDNNSQRPSEILDLPTRNFSSLRGFFGSPVLSAKYKAQGGAGIAHISNGASAQMNPAGIAGIQEDRLHYAYSSLPGNISSFYIGYGAPATEFLAQAFSVRFEGDELASEMTLFSTSALNMGKLFNHMHNIKLGLNLKGYFLSVGHKGTGIQHSTGYGAGFGLDLGIQLPLSKKIYAGLVVKDVFSYLENQNTLTNRNYTESLPPELTIGFSYQAFNSLTLLMDGQKALIEDQVDHIRLGGSYTLLSVFHVRAGTYQILNSFNSRYLTFGFGAEGLHKGYRLALDYSFEYGVEVEYSLKNYHQFNLDLGF